MIQSDSIANLAKALSIVQGKLTHAKKDSANPFFKSKYADLESVWDACRSLLADNGLAVTQFPGTYSDLDKSMSLTTILMHESGEWISHEMSVPCGMLGRDGVLKLDAQAAGSAISYMRRYSLAAVIGVVQGDDDGNAASNKVNQPVVKAKEI
jgi:hypothetical protein